MTQINEEPFNIQNAGISYRNLGIIVIAFLLGVVITLYFADNTTTTETLFKPIELIGFTLTVILSGSSIVLAIAAIALGRFSEFAITKRSDESLKLQNEVFIKTTEALQRIESSTGITEKRLEDIISGRVGDLSHKIAEVTASSDPRDLEENIRKSLLKTFRDEFYPTLQSNPRIVSYKSEEEEEENDDAKEYHKAHEKILKIISNQKDVIVEKFGHGSTGSFGSALFDGIFTKNGNKIAASTFRKTVNARILKSYLSKTVDEIEKSNINKVFIIYCARKLDEQHRELEKELNEYKSRYKEKIANKIVIIFTEYDKVNEKHLLDKLKV